jgi:tRNA (guanosine-2'-O-)-methyltransferase
MTAAGLYNQCRIDTATYQRLFFEWGHPKVKKCCMERELEYPALNEEGEIDDPSQWYAAVRELLAERDANE